MKKVSVSLFAMLAIVLAVSSAFTTSKQKKVFANDYEVWRISAGFTNSDYTYPFSITPANLVSHGKTTLTDLGSSPLGITLEEYREENEIACESQNPQVICLAYVNNATNPQSPEVLELLPGEFQQ